MPRINRPPEFTPTGRTAALTPTATSPSAPRPAVPAATFTATPGTKVQGLLTEVRELMAGRTDSKEEARVLTLFRSASAGELNQLLAGLSSHELHELIEDLDDRFIGPDHRTDFLALLSKERLGDLTVDHRAKLVHALQAGATGSLEEQAIADVFLGTKGEALTALKNLVDAGGDHRDLQQLLFHDLDSPKLRKAVLSHLAREAPQKGARVKVFSDIDDTFYVNWKDDRFPKKTVYPGVRAFYAELDKGAGAQPDRLGDLLFLSARPYDRPGLSEHFSKAMLHDHGVTQATVLSGDFAHLIGNEAIAEKKFDNWEQVRGLYPEYGSVFVGDSGQGDALFGARAAAVQGGDMRAVFIHAVTPLDAAARADFAAKGVFVFDTYVGAATEAYRQGLVSKAGLERVMSEATRELDAVPFASAAQRDARRAELDRDLAAARAALGA